MNLLPFRDGPPANSASLTPGSASSAAAPRLPILPCHARARREMLSDSSAGDHCLVTARRPNEAGIGHGCLPSRSEASYGPDTQEVENVRYHRMGGFRAGPAG